MKSSITLQKRKLQLSFSSRDSIECDKFSSKQTPGPVILATITCIKYPVTAEVIFSIFNRFGEVLKTIIFSKIQGLQAMIEMGSIEEAEKAIEEMNGQYMYSQSNLMALQFSNKQSLSVTNQSDKAKDFTKNFTTEDEPQIRKIKPTSGTLQKDEFCKLFENAFEQCDTGVFDK